MAWYECDVREAGPKAEDQRIYVALTDKKGTFNEWFRAPKTNEKEMLATALAALASGHYVNAGLTDAAGGSEITALYLGDH